MLCIAADLHCHTNVSHHAFNTITEMAAHAKKTGLDAIAVTNHAPRMPDGAHPWHFWNLVRLPARLEETYVLKGAEADLLDTAGTLDLSPQEQAMLDWLIVSIHTDIIPSLTFEQATDAWLKVAENPYVDMIGHPEQQAHFFDYDRVTKAFAQRHKVVELNANSVVVRPGSEKNLLELAWACKKNGVHIAVNSDAHSIYQLGKVEPVLAMLEKIEFPAENIVNGSIENLKKELRLHQKPYAEHLRGEDI
ncbi:MAG: phosphatase [Oscillospiraceae bacterium]|nr:phosphatase [Oscillospiraceae bacterium]